MSHPFPTSEENVPARRPRRPRRRRALIWTAVVACLAGLVGVAIPVMQHYEIPPFSEKGQPLTFDTPAPQGGGGGRNAGGGGRVTGVNALTELPTGPEAPWRVEHTLDDGTHIGVITYTGPKSGYTGKVWVWAPKAYSDPKYARSGFPVMIALPGGPGYNDNYWKDPGLKLEQSITTWYGEGKSLPFLVVMPVLNPGPDVHAHYWDGSDIPGQPKMGTWLVDDIPNLMRQNFRTIKSRDGWGFMGSSSGGFAGLKAVLKYPDRFKAALVSGPDIVPDSPFWRGHPKEQAENNPILLSKQLIARGGPDVYIAFQYGTREGSGEIGAVTSYLKQFGNKGPIHTIVNVIQSGRHNAYTYVPAMGTGPITWFSEHLMGPTPSP